MPTDWPPSCESAARLRTAEEHTAVDAFHFVQTLRLRRESNRVRVAELNDIEVVVHDDAGRRITLDQAEVQLPDGETLARYTTQNARELFRLPVLI